MTAAPNHVPRMSLLLVKTVSSPIHAAPAPTPPSSGQSARLAADCQADLRGSLTAPSPNSTRLVALQELRRNRGTR